MTATKQALVTQGVLSFTFHLLGQICVAAVVTVVTVVTARLLTLDVKNLFLQ